MPYLSFSCCTESAVNKKWVDIFMLQWKGSSDFCVSLTQDSKSECLSADNPHKIQAYVRIWVQKTCSMLDKWFVCFSKIPLFLNCNQTIWEWECTFLSMHFFFQVSHPNSRYLLYRQEKSLLKSGSKMSFKLIENIKS